MLSSPNTVLRFIMHCIIWFPQPPYEIYVRKCEGTEILLHFPTNKLAWHRLMVEDTDSWIRDNKLLTTETKASVSIYTGSVSLDFCRAVQGGPSDSRVILEDRHSKFRKAQSLKGALSKPANFLPWRETLWLFFWTTKGWLYLIFQGCLLCKHFWKGHFEQNVVGTVIHKTCRNTKDPWNIVSQQWFISPGFMNLRFWDLRWLDQAQGFASFQRSKCRGKFIVLPSSW